MLVEVTETVGGIPGMPIEAKAKETAGGGRRIPVEVVQAIGGVASGARSGTTHHATITIHRLVSAQLVGILKKCFFIRCHGGPSIRWCGRRHMKYPAAVVTYDAPAVAGIHSCCRETPVVAVEHPLLRASV